MATVQTQNTKEKSKLAKVLAPVYFHYENLRKVAILLLFVEAVVLVPVAAAILLT